MAELYRKITIFFSFILLYFYFNYAICATRLEIVFFSTGQGNLIALRSYGDIQEDNKLLFVDCGGSTAGINIIKEQLQDFSDPRNIKLRSLFSEISSCCVFITHGHRDHTNLYDLVEQI